MSRGVLQTPTLDDVLYAAQEGRCWLCDKPMDWQARRGVDLPSQDHVFPQSVFRQRGRVGLVMLAHRHCNQERGATLPSDMALRRLIAVYRRIPRWWLLDARAAIEREIAFAERLRRNVELIDLLMGLAA